MLIRVTLILTLEFYVDPSAFISLFSPFPSKCTYVMLENLEDIDLNVVYSIPPLLVESWGKRMEGL